jgi:hypothetical protein
MRYEDTYIVVMPPAVWSAKSPEKNKKNKNACVQAEKKKCLRPHGELQAAYVAHAGVALVQKRLPRTSVGISIFVPPPKKRLSSTPPKKSTHTCQAGVSICTLLPGKQENLVLGEELDALASRAPGVRFSTFVPVKKSSGLYLYFCTNRIRRSRVSRSRCPFLVRLYQ